MAEKTGKTVLYACSGASNVGQIANSVVIALAESGFASMSCIAGIGAHDQKMIDSAKIVDRVIAIDGCGVACARKILEHAGVSVTKWINVTDFGVKKNHNKLHVEIAELDNIMSNVIANLGANI